MEAVIATGGKQYRVKEGDIITVEKITEKSVTFAPLLVTDGGNVKAAGKGKVTATAIEEVKGKKLVVFKMKPKKGYRRKSGHRQRLSQLKIEKITT